MKDYKRLTTGSEFELKNNSAQGVREAINRLAELEDKIEQGTWVELPCKVGDTFWYISLANHIEEDKIANIFLRDGMCLGERLVTKIYLRDLGKSWFLTKPEAEVKLRELKGERE